MTKHARWYVNVAKWRPTREEWLKLTSSVTEDETERINKFVYQEDSKLSLIGCALIRKLVSQATRVPSNEIVLTRTQHGRPNICEEYRNRSADWPKMLDFNISHSGDYCVLAGIWSDVEQPKITVGIDVTKIVKKNTKQELDRFLSLMSRREFTQSEWETVERAQSERQKCINFTRLWCLKESFIKSIGLGLSFRLHRIDFQLDEKYKYKITTEILKNNLITTTTVLIDGRRAPDWKFIETALDDEHIVAIGYNIKSGESCLMNQNCFDIGDCFSEVSVESLIDSLTPIYTPKEENWIKFSSKSFKSA